MAIIDSLMFWKKSKDSDAGKFDLADLDKELADLEKTPVEKSIPTRATNPSAEELGTPGLTPLGQQSYNEPMQMTEIPTRPQPMQQQYPQQQSYQQQAPYDIRKDIEILSTKLDALKSAIELLNQRLQNIEALAKGEEQKRKWY